MKKHLFLLPGLKTARELSEQLESAGIDHNRIHIAHQDHSCDTNYNLNHLNLLKKNDTIHSGAIEFKVGVILAATVGFLTYNLWEGHPAGGIGTVFACLIALGFPAWLGGMIGGSSDNGRLQPCHDHIQQGGAVVMVNIKTRIEWERMNETVSNYAPARAAGVACGLENPFSGQLIPGRSLR
ncbi:hypothetical protein J7438_07515 [Thalassotalea sp. G20_0]|uniref:hypothetical protein n=1 Tax=Thalassotalea sp. G20_0 TaxID=2821093 RepID=UPI001ADBEA3C|nr:hypothetical protein [Thalassotalea sp. G20_0]MBO9493933.1 hypothetical protein [Thalassotalea sp. G20_0]